MKNQKREENEGNKKKGKTEEWRKKKKGETEVRGRVRRTSGEGEKEGNTPIRSSTRGKEPAHQTTKEGNRESIRGETRGRMC